MPIYSVSFIPLLPHYLSNIPASAFYDWAAVGQDICAIFYCILKGTKWETGLAGLIGTGVRPTGTGTVLRNKSWFWTQRDMAAARGTKFFLVGNSGGRSEGTD